MAMKLIPLILLLTLNAVAQEDKKVMEPIRLLFEGMKKSDSAMVHRAFHAQINFFTVLTDPKTNLPLLRRDEFKGFLRRGQDVLLHMQEVDRGLPEHHEAEDHKRARRIPCGGRAEAPQ